jgi:hypothetical protein
MNTVQSRRRFLGVLSAGAAAAVAPAAVAATLAPAAETPLSVPLPAAAMPSPAGEDRPFPDAKLMKLVNRYLSLDAERERIAEITDRADEEHSARYPMPDALRVQPGDAELGLPQPRGNHGERFGYSLSNMQIDSMRKPEWDKIEIIDPPEGLQFAMGGGGEVVRPFTPSPEARARADEIIRAYDEWHPKHHRTPRGMRKYEAQSERLFERLSSLEARINKTRARTIVGLLGKAKIASMAAPDPFDDPAVGAFLRDMLAMGDWMGWPGCHVDGEVFEPRGRA